MSIIECNYFSNSILIIISPFWTFGKGAINCTNQYALFIVCFHHFTQWKYGCYGLGAKSAVFLRKVFWIFWKNCIIFLESPKKFWKNIALLAPLHCVGNFWKKVANSTYNPIFSQNLPPSAQNQKSEKNVGKVAQIFAIWKTHWKSKENKLHPSKKTWLLSLMDTKSSKISHKSSRK